MGPTVIGRRRNRSWPEALKREIVAASFAPGSSVSMVARHYDVNANQVFSWRRLYRDDPRVSGVPSAPQLIPVVVTAEQDTACTQPSTVAETIEIDLDRLHDRRGLRAGCILFRRNHHRDQLRSRRDARHTRVIAIEPPPTEYLVRIHVVMPSNY